MAASKMEGSKLQDQKFMDSELANQLSMRLLETLMNKSQIEDIEDDRYLNIISRSQSRFAAPISSNKILSIKFHPSGKYLAYSRIDGSLTVWILIGTSYAKAKKIFLSNAIGVDKMIYSLSWNSNEMNQFATVANSSEIFIWGIDERKKLLTKLRTLSAGSKFKFVKCLYDPNGNWLLAVAKSEELHLFSVESDHELHSVFDVKQILPDDPIYSIIWNNSGSHIFLGSKSGKLVMLELDLQTGFMVKMTISPHRAAISKIKMDPWGRYLITASDDGTCCVWDLETFCCKSLIDDFDCLITSLDIDTPGKILCVCTMDGLVRFYDINSAKLLSEHTVKNSTSDLVLVFRPDSDGFILSGKQNTLQNHFTSSDTHDILSLWKSVRGKSLASSRGKIVTTGNVNGVNNRRPNKRERDQERHSNNTKRERGPPRGNRFSDNRQ